MYKIEYRAVIKFFVKEGLTPNEIYSKFMGTLLLRFQQLRNGLPSLNVAVPALKMIQVKDVQKVQQHQKSLTKCMIWYWMTGECIKAGRVVTIYQTLTWLKGNSVVQQITKQVEHFVWYLYGKRFYGIETWSVSLYVTLSKNCAEENIWASQATGWTGIAYSVQRLATSWTVRG